MWWALNVAVSFPGKYLKNRQTPGNAWKTREKLWNGLEHVSRSYLKMFVDFGASQSMHIFCSRQSVVIVRTSRGGQSFSWQQMTHCIPSYNNCGILSFESSPLLADSTSRHTRFFSVCSLCTLIVGSVP